MPGETLDDTPNRVERAAIVDALAKTGGNRTAAARPGWRDLRSCATVLSASGSIVERDGGVAGPATARLDAGWLVGVRREPSPNFDARPDGESPWLLVVLRSVCRHVNSVATTCSICSAIGSTRSSIPTSPASTTCVSRRTSFIRRDGKSHPARFL